MGEGNMYFSRRNMYFFLPYRLGGAASGETPARLR